jgi:hypothetical protein
VGGTGHRGAEPPQEQLRPEQQRRNAAAYQTAVAAPACIASGTAPVVAARLAVAAVVSLAVRIRRLQVE